MAFLFRPSYKDKRTGKTKRTKNWYAGVPDPATGKTRRVPLCQDKTAAQAMLADLLRNQDREAAGIAKPKPKRTVEEAVTGWTDSLRAKAAKEKHVGMATSRVRKVFGGVETVDQITAAVVERQLVALREEGGSVQTCNHYLATCKAFLNWLVAEEWLPRNPLARLRKSNPKKDLRHGRRALTDAEFSKLIEAAAASTQAVLGLSGKDRRMLYLVAAATGFRASELAALKPSSFALAEDSPLVRGRAAYAKNGKDVAQPLPPALVGELRAYLAEKPDGPLWAGTWHQKAAKLLQHDLAACGLPYKTEEGFADFHALRTLFITGLFRAGVHPKVAQRLARHSTMELTMETYTRVADEELAAGVARLRLPCMGLDSDP